MTSRKRTPLPSDPNLAPTPLPLGPALVRGAVLALALGVAACGDDDGDAVPMVPPDMGQRDLGSDGFIGPMPPPADLGPETDAGSDEDLGASDLGESDLGTDAGIIPPMPPPPDSGIIAPMPPPMPDPMPDPIPPMPPPPPPPK